MYHQIEEESELYGRRNGDQKKSVQINAITAYCGMAAFAGAIVLWIASSLIDQQTRGLADMQLITSVKVQANIEAIEKFDKKIDSINSNINTRFDKFDARFQQLQEFLIKK